MAIAVQNRQRAVRINTPQVKRQLLRIMTYLNCQDQELSVVFANDHLLHELNRTYRDKDRPTNVLAFPQEPIDTTGPSSRLLGDVVVSLPTADREAQLLDQPLEARVVYLLIHGLLHLLGYDHEQSDTAQQRMEALEQELLAYLTA
ncbi:rRNA maturation RNase YbeY [Candidatus Entotheonella serta]|nr:rRNA maturation RNase YbeY [Candidatus Entotheonella serta]